MLLKILNVLLLLLIGGCFTQNLPKFFPRCELDDPDLNNCIGRAANALRPYIKQGIEELQFPSLDPFVISTMDLNQAGDGVNYNATVRNYTVEGLYNYDITDVRYDPETKIFSGTIEFPSVYVRSWYTGKGTVLTLPIEGEGLVNKEYGSISGTFEVTGTIVKRKGIEYYKPLKTTVKFTIADSSYHFDGLFDGNEQLGSFTNDFINQNSKAITNALTVLYNRLAENGLMYLMKSLMGAIPYEALFPPTHKLKI